MQSGLTITERFWADIYVGSAHDLVKAGVITASQLPGQLGKNKTMCTYVNGVPVRQGTNCVRDEHYLCVRRKGKGFAVVRGLPKHVEAERHARLENERTVQNVRTPKSHLTLVWSAP